MENGNWKFENGSRESGTTDETENQFPVSTFQFPVLQARECESRLFEGWRETTHWRKFIVNSPRDGGEFKGGTK
jgi:hypothetical protein